MRIKMRIKHFQIWFCQHPVLMAFSYLVVLFLFTYWIYGVQFEGNDDVGYFYAAAGMTTGTPSPPAAHMNILYAYPVSLLYMITRAVPWYALCFLGLIFCSCWCILTVLLKTAQGKGLPLFYPILVYTALHIAAVLLFSVILQFTFVGGICAATACVFALFAGPQ